MHILFCNQLFLLEVAVNPLVDEQADREAFHTLCFQGNPFLTQYVSLMGLYSLCVRVLGESKGER